jgi:hypothetical protein
MSTTSQDFRTDQRNAGRLRKAVRQRSWTFIVILVIVLSLFSYLAGMYTISRDLAQTRLLLQALQTETQKARRDLAAQNSSQTNLQAQLQRTKAELEAIRPSKDSFVISPNQSITVGEGLLTIGLIGSPTNGSVSLNVNGVRHALGSGDVLQLNLTKSSCRIAVQSFDMFKATIVASCGTPT